MKRKKIKKFCNEKDILPNSLMFKGLKKHTFLDDDTEFTASFIFAKNDFSYYLAKGNRLNKN